MILPLVLSVSVGSAQSTQRNISRRNQTPVPQRVALVIGNSNYSTASSLKNPVNDADGVALALKGYGFEVILGLDLDKKAMRQHIDTFRSKMVKNGIALFYYAGHGVQIENTNYLIPVDANATNQVDIEFGSIEVDYVLAQMEESRNTVNIIILDACRNNPFPSRVRSSQQGLAEVTGPIGSIIAYSAAPGKVADDGDGRHGIYTEALLQHLREKETGLSQIFNKTRNAVLKKTNNKQTPWESTSLRCEFYFARATQCGTEGPSIDAPAANDSNGSTGQGTIVRPEPLPVAIDPPLVNSPKSPVINQLSTNSVTVSANQDWVSAGISVEARDRIKVDAYGNVLLKHFGPATADGVPGNDPRRPLSNCPTGALIAKVGSSSTPVCLGSAKMFTVQESGELIFSLNLGQRRDHTGLINVSVVQFRYQ
jgi:hypothetical protein